MCIRDRYDVEAFTAEDFGNTMMQELAKAMGEKGQYALLPALLL